MVDQKKLINYPKNMFNSQYVLLRKDFSPPPETRKITERETYTEHSDDVQLSETTSPEGSAAKFKHCEGDCEIPSQSNIVNSDYCSATLSNCKTIVSLAPDSTNE